MLFRHYARAFADSPQCVPRPKLTYPNFYAPAPTAHAERFSDKYFCASMSMMTRNEYLLVKSRHSAPAMRRRRA